MAEQKEVMDAEKNCPACKKVMRRARRYYRNGKYYCNNNCYKKFFAEAAK